MNLKEQFEELGITFTSDINRSICFSFLELKVKEAYEQGRKDSLEFREKLRQLYVKSHGKNLPMEAVEMGVLAQTQTLKEIREVVEGMEENAKKYPMMHKERNEIAVEATDWNNGYNSALQDILNKLKNQR